MYLIYISERECYNETYYSTGVFIKKTIVKYICYRRNLKKKREKGNNLGKISKYDPRYGTLKKLQKNGKNAAIIQQENRSLIIQLIRENKAISRKQLAVISGLQQATVTIITQDLLNKEIICENGMIDGDNGRKVKALSISKSFYVISLELTDFYIIVSAFDIQMKPVYVEKIFFEENTCVLAWVKIVKEQIQKIGKVVAKEKILCMVLGISTSYQMKDGDYFIYDSMSSEYIHIGRLLREQTGYRTFVNRVINFTAYGQWDKYICADGKEDDYASMLIIRLSYRLEGAMIVNREVIYGQNGECGQLADIYMDRESPKKLGELVTAAAILKRAKEMLRKYPDSSLGIPEDINIRDVIQGYNEKDPLCIRIYDEVIYYLGYVIAFMLNWLDPDVLVLSDEIPATEEFQEALRQEVAKYSSEEKAQRVCVDIAKRSAENDPALFGGVQYAFDLMISEGDLE